MHTETLDAAAIWLPPSEPHFSVRRLARLGYLTAVFKLDPWALIRSVATMTKLERLHERDVQGPHWYLAVLGVDPPRQGQGVGGSIIQPVLRRADMEGLPCYLETGKEIDVRFYRKYGFEVLEEGRRPATFGFPCHWTSASAEATQVRAATIDGKPMVGRDNSSTWSISGSVTPASRACHVWERTAPSRRAPTEIASLTSRRVRSSSGPASWVAFASASYALWTAGYSRLKSWNGLGSSRIVDLLSLMTLAHSF